MILGDYMYKKLKIFHIVSAIIVAILGTILHFTYDWSGNNNLIALFSSINESTWEHLKLIFFPMLLASVIGYFTYLKPFSSFWCSRALGILVSLTFIVIFFYTYSGILGKNIAIIDIISFFISVILGELTSYRLMNNNIPCKKICAITFLIIVTISFFIFTFKPPHIGLFRNPINGSHGIKKI